MLVSPLLHSSINIVNPAITRLKPGYNPAKTRLRPGYNPVPGRQWAGYNPAVTRFLSVIRLWLVEISVLYGVHTLIIFASGKGSNAAAIIEYFKEAGGARVGLIVTNKADAGVIDIAAAEGIPVLKIDRKGMGEQAFIDEVSSYSPSLIVLAGFLLKIPPSFIEAFRGRIVNIHPALLPNYGGKGMWGHHVHEAVLASGDTQSGISIHLVDEEYDHGATLLQARCAVLKGDTADDLAARVHRLEHFYYPRTIDFLLRG
jgi:phosphoribosylglycinamide formyltransferase-1